MKLYGFWRSLATYRVRGLSLIAAADGHPLITPRIRTYLEKEMRQDEAARNRWLAHWTMRALEAIEGHLAREKETGRFCHGNELGMADMSVATMPAKPEDAKRVIANARAVLDSARKVKIPVIHVVLVYRRIPGIGS